jgi:hypothetical protein
MPLYSVPELLKSDFKVEYWIKPFVSKGGTVLLSAPAKSMKTFLGMQAGLAIASGQKFMDWPTDPNGARVLYIDQEIGEAEAKARLQYMYEVYGGEKADANFRIFTGDVASLSLDKELKRGADMIEEIDSKGLRELKQLLKDFKPQVVIFDTMRDSHSGEENSSTEMSKVMKTLRQLKKEFGFTAMLIHHTGKPQLHMKTTGRGSTAVPGAATQIGTITPEEVIVDGTVRIVLNTHWEQRGTRPIEDTRWEFWPVPSLPTDEYESVPIGNRLFQKGMGLFVNRPKPQADSVRKPNGKVKGAAKVVDITEGMRTEAEDDDGEEVSLND